MKISIEAKIGIIGIVAIVVLIWGVNYLKGKNFLISTYTLYAFFDDAGGIESSAPVLLNGVKIGYVDDLQLLPGQTPPIKAVLHIEKLYPIHKGSRAELYSADLLGTKAIRITLSGKEQPFQDSDTILTSVAPDMLASLQEKIMPVMQQIKSLAVSLDTLASKLDTILGSETTRETLQNLASISRSLSTSLDKGGGSESKLQEFGIILGHVKGPTG